MYAYNEGEKIKEIFWSIFSDRDLVPTQAITVKA